MRLLEILALCRRVAAKCRVDKIHLVRVVGEQGPLHIAGTVAAQALDEPGDGATVGIVNQARQVVEHVAVAFEGLGCTAQLG